MKKGGCRGFGGLPPRFFCQFRGLFEEFGAKKGGRALPSGFTPERYCQILTTKVDPRAARVTLSYMPICRPTFRMVLPMQSDPSSSLHTCIFN